MRWGEVARVEWRGREEKGRVVVFYVSLALRTPAHPLDRPPLRARLVCRRRRRRRRDYLRRQLFLLVFSSLSLSRSFFRFFFLLLGVFLVRAGLVESCSLRETDEGVSCLAVARPWPRARRQSVRSGCWAKVSGGLKQRRAIKNDDKSTTSRAAGRRRTHRALDV